MYIENTYIGILNNKNVIWCGFKPKNKEAVIKEIRNILYPENGYVLKRISDNEYFDSVWLKDGDTEENYNEVEVKDDDSE